METLYISKDEFLQLHLQLHLRLHCTPLYSHMVAYECDMWHHLDFLKYFAKQFFFKIFNHSIKAIKLCRVVT
jgi:hypothetical protein